MGVVARVLEGSSGLQGLPKRFSQYSVEKQLNSLQGKNLACAKMVPRKVEVCARSGHVTGQRSLRGRGSRKGLQRAPTNTMLFSDYHLAKLNPNCHMNYLDYL